MDFINGGELFFHLRREQRFSEDRARFYAAEVILALSHLHQNGILYRDLKPENILIDQEGHVKITDFGLSKVGLSKMQGSETYSFCGTPEYLAPEIIQGKGHTFAVDWWSLGLVLYEMICGHHPYKLRNKNKFEKFQMISDMTEHI
jgi:serine/threonine protein kinase